MAALPSPATHRAPTPRPHEGAPAPAERPDLRVVDRPRHHRRYLALLTLTVALGVLGVVSLHALAAEAAFDARTLEAEAEALAQRSTELTAEVAALESPERIREIAIEELGMVPARQPGYLVLDEPAAPAGPQPDDADALAREG
ncbi:MAG: septum formation initiator family protein [Actinomycetota bacterium]